MKHRKVKYTNESIGKVKSVADFLPPPDELVLKEETVMKIVIKKASSPDDIQKCFTIRNKVFVEGQNVPLHEEVDGKDQDSEHYLLLVDTIPVGTTRVRYLNDYAKIERVAILDDYQGKGLGKQMMEVIMSELKKQPALTKAKLSSQTYAISFYEKLGFAVCSEEYMDAGIPHKDMEFCFENNNLE